MKFEMLVRVSIITMLLMVLTMIEFTNHLELYLAKQDEEVISSTLKLNSSMKTIPITISYFTTFKICIELISY